MLDLQQIKNEYSEPLQGYERAIVREYLQHKILEAIFESTQASKLSFLGGTALRIVHGNSRFSEDIDLDNFGLSWQALGELTQKLGISSPESLREGMLLKIRNFDFDALAGDVAPFLITKEQVKRVVKFREFWKQVELD